MRELIKQYYNKYRIMIINLDQWESAHFLQSFVEPAFVCKILLDNYDEIEDTNFDLSFIYTIFCKYIIGRGNHSIPILGYRVVFRDFHSKTSATNFIEQFYSNNIEQRIKNVISFHDQ